MNLKNVENLSTLIAIFLDCTISMDFILLYSPLNKFFANNRARKCSLILLSRITRSKWHMRNAIVYLFLFGSFETTLRNKLLLLFLTASEASSHRFTSGIRPLLNFLK